METPKRGRGSEATEDEKLSSISAQLAQKILDLFHPYAKIIYKTNALITLESVCVFVRKK